MTTEEFEAFSEEDIEQVFRNAFFNHHSHRWEQPRPYVAAFEPFCNKGAFFLQALEEQRVAMRRAWLVKQLIRLQVNQTLCSLYVLGAGWYVLANDVLDLAVATGVAFLGFLLANTLREQTKQLT